MPVLYITLLSNILTGIFLDDQSYTKALQNGTTHDDTENLITTFVSEQLSNNIPQLKAIVITPKVKDYIKEKLVKKNEIAKQYENNLTGIVKYLNNKEDSIDKFLAVNATITLADTDDLKSNITLITVENILTLPKCPSDADFTRQLNSGDPIICKPSSSTADITAQVSAVVNKSISNEKIKGLFNLQLPVDARIKDYLDSIRQNYPLAKNAITIGAAASVVLLLIIFLLNVVSGNFYFRYFASTFLLTAIGFGTLGGVLQYLILPLINFKGGDLQMSAVFSIDVADATAKLGNSIMRFFVEALYTSVYAYAAILVGVAIVLWILQFIFRHKKRIEEDEKVFKKKSDMYIPAFSNRDPRRAHEIPNSMAQSVNSDEQRPYIENVAKSHLRQVTEDKLREDMSKPGEDSGKIRKKKKSK